MKHIAALPFIGWLALSACSDNETRPAYEACVANSRGLERIDAEAFCSCLRDDSNLDMHAAHPAEECAEQAERLNPPRR
ncbi:MAG TPA: hypothetical protein VF727_12415 [Allosphingosinicella sp.]|jgi:hypothetical protein